MMALARGARRIDPAQDTRDGAMDVPHAANIRIEPRVTPPPASASKRAAPASESAALVNLPMSDAGATHFKEITPLAKALIADAMGPAGYRTLVTADAPGIEVIGDAMDLVSALTKASKSVILVDWCPEGGGYATLTQTPDAPGLCELLAGKVSFEHVVNRVPGSYAHVIVTGDVSAGGSAAFDSDRINLVLDALDEAYEHIVVSGRHHPAKALFETIQGRFEFLRDRCSDQAAPSAECRRHRAVPWFRCDGHLDHVLGTGRDGDCRGTHSHKRHQCCRWCGRPGRTQINQNANPKAR